MTPWSPVDSRSSARVIPRGHALSDLPQQYPALWSIHPSLYYVNLSPPNYRCPVGRESCWCCVLLFARPLALQHPFPPYAAFFLIPYCSFSLLSCGRADRPTLRNVHRPVLLRLTSIHTFPLVAIVRLLVFSTLPICRLRLPF